MESRASTESEREGSRIRSYAEQGNHCRVAIQH